MNSHYRRRSLLSGLGAALAGLTFRPRAAQAQSPAGAPPFEPARHPQDAWMDALAGKHRTVIDCAASAAAGTGVFYANNIFTANRNGYQLGDSDVAVIVVLRHEATTFAYNDAIWGKSGVIPASGGRSLAQCIERAHERHQLLEALLRRELQMLAEQRAIDILRGSASAARWSRVCAPSPPRSAVPPDGNADSRTRRQRTPRRERGRACAH